MDCASTCMCTFATAVILFLVVGLPLLIIYGGAGPDDPEFTVESAAVRAYNLTSDNRLFCIFDISVRAHNRDTKHSVKYEQLDLEVRKGKHHKLADDAVTPFRQPPGTGTVVAVEAVGLFVRLQEETAGELREDSAAGATTVNVFFTGSLGSTYNINIKCRNVKVYFQDSSKFEKVGCKVDVYDTSAD